MIEIPDYIFLGFRDAARAINKKYKKTIVELRSDGDSLFLHFEGWRPLNAKVFIHYQTPTRKHIKEAIEMFIKERM